MTRDELFDTINDVDDKYIEAAASYNINRVSRLRVRYLAAAASVMVMAGIIVLLINKRPFTKADNESEITSNISDVELEKRFEFGTFAHKDDIVTDQTEMAHNGEVIMSKSLMKEMENGKENKALHVVIKLFRDDAEIIDEETYNSVLSELLNDGFEANKKCINDKYCLELIIAEEQLDAISAGQDLGFFVDEYDSFVLNEDNQNISEEK